MLAASPRPKRGGSLVGRATAPSFEPDAAALRTGLEACGLAVADTRVILSRLASGTALRDVSAAIARGEILRKRSARGREHVLAAVRHRYAAAPAPLAPIPALAAGLEALPAATARAQLLLPYVLRSDRGAYEVATGLILPRLAGGGTLAKAEVVAALDGAFARRRRKPWSPALRARWAGGVLSVLREVGALGAGARRERLLPWAVLPEPFAFHLWGLYGAGS
jgi:hypothetical protein